MSALSFQKGIEMTIDGLTYKTVQLINLNWGLTTYIGGYVPKYHFFIGCMNNININGKSLEFNELTANQKEGSIEVR